MALVQQLREESEPVRVEVTEPEVSLAEYERIRSLQRAHAELHRQGLYRQAFEAAHEALEACARNYGTLHPATLSAMNNLAVALKGNGQVLEAKLALATVFEGYVKLFGQRHRHALLALHNLAKVYQQNREPDTALKLCDELLQLLPGLEEPDHALLLQCRLNQAACLRDTDRLAEAQTLLGLALADLDRSAPAADSLARASLLASLGLTLKRLKQLAEAESHYKAALRIRAGLLPAHHPEVMVCYHNLSVLYAEMGDPGRAQDMQARAQAVLEQAVRRDAGRPE